MDIASLWQILISQFTNAGMALQDAWVSFF